MVSSSPTTTTTNTRVTRVRRAWLRRVKRPSGVCINGRRDEAECSENSVPHRYVSVSLSRSLSPTLAYGRSRFVSQAAEKTDPLVGYRVLGAGVYVSSYCGERQTAFEDNEKSLKKKKSPTLRSGSPPRPRLIYSRRCFAVCPRVPKTRVQ